MMVNEICEKKYNKPLSGCTNKEIYYALLDITKDLAAKKESEAGTPGLPSHPQHRRPVQDLLPVPLHSRHSQHQQQEGTTK